MSSKILWPILIIFTAIFTGLLAFSNSNGALRPVLTFIFILFCPGLAFTRLMHLKDPVAEFVLTVALSLVVSTILAELMLLPHLWSPTVYLAALIVFSLVGSVLQIKYALQPTISKEIIDDKLH